MDNLKKILIAVILFIWVIMPDLIPGPIDDVIALVFAIRDVKSICPKSNYAEQ